MSVTPSRRAALAVLRRVRERGAFGPETLDAVLKAAGLSAPDTALATRLAYGALEAQGVLDEALDADIARPADVDPAVRDALRLAAYELLYARTPARAAVHEGVEAVKALRPRAAGFANAVLRKLAARADSFPWGDPDTDDDALARACALPRWIVDLFVRDLGRVAGSEAARAHALPAPLYLLHNPFRGSLTEALDALATDGAEPEPWGPPGCVRALRPVAAVRGAAVGSGRVIVTDASAQVAAAACRPRPGDVVADIAAGRGTKTLQLQAIAVAAGGPADIRALDVHPFKRDVLARRMETLGVPGVTALVGDALAPEAVEGLPGPGGLDRVLLDAPCTGLGTLRRHPEKRWRLSPEDPARLAVLQGRMLDSLAPLVRPGGLMVYSTCSVARTENHEVAEGFLARSSGRFRTVPPGDAVPEPWRGDVGPEGWFGSHPRTEGPDGHFVAVFERME